MTARAIATSIPTSITSQFVDNAEPLSYITSLCPEFVKKTLRDAFYLPLYKKTIAPCLELDQKVASRLMNVLTTIQALGSPELKLVRDFFSVRDIPVYIEGKTFRTFTIRLFESKEAINAKKLRVILFSFNVNKEAPQRGGTEKKWEPLTIKDLSDGPLSVLRALKQGGVKVDSLVTASLGNVTFDGLKHTPDSEAASMIPSTLVINRGMTSTQKVANQLYSMPVNYFLWGLAKWCSWDTNPEQELLNFLQKNRQTKREVVMIEATKDYFFSGKGGFDPNYHTKLIQLGMVVFRANFFPFPFQIRSHHALTLEHLENNCVTKIPANTIPFSFPEGEKVSSMIAREIFHRGEGDFHTCFYVAGNDATLDTGGIRDVVPLLAAFIVEGKKLAKSDIQIAS